MDSQGPKAKLEELKNIMPFWLGMGCDGFRVDMAGSLVKHDKEFPEATMVSEWGEPDKSLQWLSHGFSFALWTISLQRFVPM